MALQLIDFGRLTVDLPRLSATYRQAEPYPHVVLDDVLNADAFAAAAAEFPALGDESWKGYLHVNETKFANTDPQSWGPTLRAVASELLSPEFTAFLTELTGIENLLPDETLDGGGLHQTLRGGHLNVHADFTTHHTRENWARRVNILLYLNERWEEQWAGQLELWDRDMTACRARVTPRGNRMLVFTTSTDSFHGHPDPLACPQDVARRSLALYYFTEQDSPVRKATNYRARPDDGMKKVAIWADRVALDVYDRTKRRMGWSDEKVSAMLERVNRLRRRNR